MSYQVLARKWRPANFTQVVGQSHVLHALTNALGQQRLHHAYLFTGTRGVGKTSLARLFAKGLNCETGITATPCGRCSACREIAEGRFVDLIEVDAASRTKVDDTREILDNVQYRPSRGRFKVYLIDEVHMLSKSSFNALLKTLEEPPEHVKFLLATTDPQKLPVTVLSRCLQFNLKALTQTQIQQQLASVLEGEGLGFDEAALELLARSAAGSMRDALSLTDQAIAFGGGEVRLAGVQTMLGAIDGAQILSLFEALCGGDIERLLTGARSALSFGADADEVLRALLELLHQISLAQFAPATAQISEHGGAVLGWANALSPEQVQLFYQILLLGRKDLPFAPTPGSGLEMALLRAVGFVPQTPVTRWQAGEGIKSSPAPITAAPTTATVVAAPVTAAVTAPKPLMAEVRDSEPAPTPAPAPQTAQQPHNIVIDEDADDEDEQALFAEQAVLMSQAQSQGFVPYQGQADTDASGDIDPDYAAEYAKDYVEDGAQHGAAPFDGSDFYGFAGEPDLFGGTGTDISAQTEPTQSPVSTPASQPPLAVQSQPSVPATSEAVQASELKSPGFGDDLLDAVLACRDDLLTEIAREAKEDDPKKPVSGLSRRTAAAAQPVESASGTEAGESSATAASVSAANAENTMPSAGAIAVQQSTSVEDRPPWEEPPMVAAQDLVAPKTNVLRANEPVIAPEVTAPEGIGQHAVYQHSDQAQAQAQAPTPEVNAIAAEVAAVPAAIRGDETDLRWYKLMAALEIGGRVRQLAVNSVCLAWENPIPLVLKQDQKHLAAPVAINQLNEALSRAVGQPATIALEVGEMNGRETPLEIRARFDRELQGEAARALMTDPAIALLMAQTGAWLDEHSITYPKERLAARGRALPEPPALIPGGE